VFGGVSGKLASKQGKKGRPGHSKITQSKREKETGKDPWKPNRKQEVKKEGGTGNWEDTLECKAWVTGGCGVKKGKLKKEGEAREKGTGTIHNSRTVGGMEKRRRGSTQSE